VVRFSLTPTLVISPLLQHRSYRSSSNKAGSRPKKDSQGLYFLSHQSIVKITSHTTYTLRYNSLVDFFLQPLNLLLHLYTSSSTPTPLLPPLHLFFHLSLHLLYYSHFNTEATSFSSYRSSITTQASRKADSQGLCSFSHHSTIITTSLLDRVVKFLQPPHRPRRPRHPHQIDYPRFNCSIWTASSLPSLGECSQTTESRKPILPLRLYTVADTPCSQG
jgi:hypothetical protein